MTPLKKIVLLIFVIVLGLFFITAGLTLFYNTPLDGERIVLYYGHEKDLFKLRGYYHSEALNIIPHWFSKAENYDELARELKLQKKIHSVPYFQLTSAVVLKEKVKQGFYIFPEKITLFQVLKILKSAPARINPVVILPGFDLKDIERIMIRQGLNAEGGIQRAASDSRLLKRFKDRYGYKPKSLNGYIAPGLYFVHSSENTNVFYEIISESLKMFYEETGKFALKYNKAEDLHKAVISAAAAQKALQTHKKDKLPPRSITTDGKNSPICNPDAVLILKALLKN